MKILLLSLLFLYADGSIKPPDLPTFSEEPQDAWFKENSTALLNCFVNSHSAIVSYQWMFGSNVVLKYKNLTSIQVSKYGAYRCLVSNWFGTIISRTAQVKKPVLKYLLMKDVQKKVSEGESLFLPSVEVFKSIPPVAKVFWEKKTGTDKWDVVGEASYTKNGSLLIIAASKDAEDDTNYRFMIQQNNGDTVIGYNVQVTITGEPSNYTCENSSVVFMEVPKSVSVYAGEAISIECLAILRKCKFPPSYKWYRKTIISSEPLSREKNLIITKTNLSDADGYRCVVQTQESKYEAETLVVVTEKSRIKTGTSGFLTVSFKDGVSVTLDGNILTSTDGLQKVDWYVNGKLISRNSKYNFTTDNKLIINQPNVSYSGIYQVFYFFNGFELNDTFNAVFVNELEKSSVVGGVFSSMSLYSPISISSDFKLPISLSKGSLSLNLKSSISHSPFLSTPTSFFHRTPSTEILKISSMYLPFHASSSFSFLIPSSFSLSLKTSFVSSSISVSSQSAPVIFPNQIPKKDQINNVTLIIVLSAVSAVSVIVLLISLLIRKRYSQKKATSVQVSEELVTRAKKKRDSSSGNDDNNYALPVYRRINKLKEQGTSDQFYAEPNSSNLKLKPECESHENPYWGDEPDYNEIEIESSLISSTEPNDSYIQLEPSNLYTFENGFSDHDSNRAKWNDDIEPDYKELEVSVLNLANLSSNYASICADLKHELYEPLVDGGSKKKISPKYEIRRPFIKDSCGFLSKDSSTSRLSNIYTPLNTQQLHSCSTLESNKTENYYSGLNSPKPSLKNSNASPQSYASLNLGVPSNAPSKLCKNAVSKK